MRLFCCLLVCFFASVASAQTNYTAVTISSPTRWTKAMSPITVTTRVDLYSSLTIDAGVVVRFGPQAIVHFWNGSASQLLVNGTQAEPVTMTAATATPWTGLIVPGTRSTRPIVRATYLAMTGLGGRTVNITPLNMDLALTDCLIESLPAVPAGLANAGQPVFAIGTASNSIVSLQRCLFRGQTNGVGVNLTTAIDDCDFESVASPVRPVGARINVTALPY